MKNTALLAAIAAALIATPAAAAGGHVGLTYGQTDADATEADTLQLDGAIGSSAGTWGWQADGAIGNSEFDGGDDADHHSITGHLYWQGGSGWRLGGVVGAANIEDSGTEVDEFIYGAEGTFDVGPNTVLTGSVTAGELDLGGDIDTFNVDAGVRFYAGSNLRFAGTIGTGNLDAGGVDVDTFTAGINAEWAPFSAPVSFTAAWQTFSDDDTIIGDADTISVGARWNFGGGSLRDRDNATPFETASGAFYPRALGLY